MGRAFGDYFEKLLQQEGCQEAWTIYVDGTTAAFPQQLAKGTAPLNGFWRYALVGNSSFLLLFSSSKPDS